jgi:hypothetical protein
MTHSPVAVLDSSALLAYLRRELKLGVKVQVIR